ncbi:MAG: hypothetical protein PHQ59_01610 [Candidatus Daviesbacteria bacterium]|nr:hypothetical protein [Candidatus Daviesbacteria bacterium]
MDIYIFGNKDIAEDNLAFKVLRKIKGKITNLNFIVVAPNEDLPFADKKNVIILDTIQGINEVTVFDETFLDKLIFSKSISVHDFDLGFQLAYLQKLGKLKNITVIGLPQSKSIDYNLIHSIFKKLVAQDIQGS